MFTTKLSSLSLQFSKSFSPNCSVLLHGYDLSALYKDDSATAVVTVTVSGRLRQWSARTPEKWVSSIEGHLTPLTIVGGVEHHCIIDVDCITIPATTFLDGEPNETGHSHLLHFKTMSFRAAMNTSIPEQI